MNYEEIKKQIGERIVLARRDSGIRQMQLARRMRWGKGSIEMLENGKRAIKAHELPQLSSILNRSISWIVTGYDDFELEKT